MHTCVGWSRLGVFHAILNGALNDHFCQQGNPTSQQDIRFLMVFKLVAGFLRACRGICWILGPVKNTPRVASQNIERPAHQIFDGKACQQKQRAVTAPGCPAVMEKRLVIW